MGTPTEVNKYTQEVSGKFFMYMIKPLDECQVWDSSQWWQEDIKK